MVKRLQLMALAVLVSTAAIAQDKVETTVAADVVSQYVWRGQDLGNVALQPTLGISWKGLELSAWGSVGLAEASDTKEMDLTLSYTLGGLTVGLTDYWFNEGPAPDAKYFKYSAHETNHVFEAHAGYDFGFLALNAYTNLGGNDGVNKDGDRAYSTYVELSAPFRLASVDWEAAVGAVPYATSFYATNGFAVTNVSLKATKELPITKAFSVPVFGQLVANPRTEKAYLVVGFTLQP